MTTLRVQGPGGHAFVTPLRDGETTIGRDTASGLALSDARVSRRHALLRVAGGAVSITDLESRNGTYHNGRRLGAAAEPLAAGDVVKIGDFTLVLEASAAAAPPDDPLRAVLQKAPHELLVSGAIPPGGGPERSAEGLRHELEKKTRVLGLFYELSRTLGSVFSLPDVYQKAMELLLQVTPAARVVIFQRPGRGEMQQVAASARGTSPAAAPTPVTDGLPVSRTVFDDVTRRRVSVLLENTGPGATAMAGSLTLQQAHSVMAAPILGRKGLLGVIYADQQDAPRAFSSDDLDLLNAVAVQTGVAIDTVLAHEALRREAQAREKYERFLPQQLVDDVMLDPDKELKPGGRRQTVSVLFADLRGFTTTAEAQPPEVVVELLNRFFTLMSEVVFRHGGTLDKYLGDGVMALFGAPYATERDALKAVRAAIEMQRFVATFNRELAAAGRPAIGLGVGINTGPAIVGFVGSDTRLDYTAIGDTVNTASRLEHLAVAGQIIIGEATMQALDASVAIRPLEAVQVKGRVAKLQIAEVSWAKG